MKSTIRKSTFLAIYRLLDKVSPLNEDCGKLCNCACCTGGGSVDDINDEDEFELGIYLLPGEEKVFTQKEDWLVWTKEPAQDYDFPDSWSGNVYFIRCKTPPICQRNKRPLQCRFFPLSPRLDENDNLSLVYSNVETPYSCPLIYEEYPLNTNFIKASLTVWKRLIKDPLIYDLVKKDSYSL